MRNFKDFLWEKYKDEMDSRDENDRKDDYDTWHDWISSNPNAEYSLKDYWEDYKLEKAKENIEVLDLDNDDIPPIKEPIADKLTRVLIREASAVDNLDTKWYPYVRPAVMEYFQKRSKGFYKLIEFVNALENIDEDTYTEGSIRFSLYGKL